MQLVDQPVSPTDGRGTINDTHVVQNHKLSVGQLFCYADRCITA